MLTPRFKISQNDHIVEISIYAPFTHVSETEIFMEGTDFRFYSKPYFLRLHFSGEIEENDSASAKFDAETCSYIVKCSKVNQGEFFKNLDMITELCKPKGSDKISAPEIEELDGGEDHEDESWYFDQNIPTSSSSTDLENQDCFGIGFGMVHYNVFDKLLEEFKEILDLKEPEKLSLKDRRTERLNLEQKDFNSEHYLCDLFEPDDCLTEALEYKLPEFSNVLTPDENLALTNYSRKNIKIRMSVQSTLYGLVDILYAYCYDFKTTLGEHNSETGWLISKLSATLACSEVFDSIKDCVIANMRRTLIYPLFRSFDIAVEVLKDVQKLLKNGKVAILKILLDLTKIFNESEGRYIFNQLYIDQYVPWIQTVEESELKDIVDQLSVLVKEISKEDLQLELLEIESAAVIVMKEQDAEDESNLVEKFQVKNHV